MGTVKKKAAKKAAPKKKPQPKSTAKTVKASTGGGGGSKKSNVIVVDFAEATKDLLRDLIAAIVSAPGKVVSITGGDQPGAIALPGEEKPKRTRKNSADTAAPVTSAAPVVDDTSVNLTMVREMITKVGTTAEKAQGIVALMAKYKLTAVSELSEREADIPKFYNELKALLPNE